MKRLLCFPGAVLVGVSAFCPIVSVPIFGSVNYMREWPYVAYTLLAVAILALGLAVFRVVEWAWMPGCVALCVAASTVYRFREKTIAVERHLGAHLAGNPFAGLARGLAHTVHLQWGVGVLIAGGVLLVAGACVPSSLVPARR